MNLSRAVSLIALLLTPIMAGCRHSAASGTHRSLFDGATLAGWSAPDMSYWTVEDHAITGTTTREHNPERNQFIVWQGGQPGDFELTFEFRLFGAQANSGMQFRSEVKEFGLVHGYQADMDGAGKYLGGIWDEYGTRHSLAARGERVVIAADGVRHVTLFAPAGELLKGLRLDQWNRYTIRAVGPKMTLFINGQVTAELEDHELGKAAALGVLAMPIIPGEPMKVQYRNLQLLEF